MADAEPTVFVVDDDQALLASVGRLLRSVGLRTQQFSSVSDFLNADPPDGPTCLVLDIRIREEAVLSFSATLPRRTGGCR